MADVREVADAILNAAQDEHRPLRLRQGIAASALAGGTFTVRLGGSSVAVPARAMVSAGAIAAGDTVWLLQDGPLLLALGRAT